MTVTKDVLHIYKEDCLRCSHLCALKKENYFDCTQENGNEYCPASLVSIIVNIPVETIVDKILLAESSNNYIELSRIYAKLENIDISLQEKVKERLSEKRTNFQSH